MTSRCYAVRGGKQMMLDVFSPAKPNGVSILLIHGGALLVGQKEAMHHYAPPLTERGFTVFTPAYRLLSEAYWPGPLDDIKAGIAWVREHAGELKVDPDKIALEGFSAGGMLALASAREPGVAAVVSFFAAAHYNPQPGAMGSLGPRVSADEIAASAPINAIGAGYPATMILHGTADKRVPYTNAVQLFEKLLAAGVKADLRLYHDHVHEFSMEPSILAPVQRDVALFLDRAVVSPQRYAEEAQRTNPFLQSGGPPPRFPPYLA